MLLKDISKAILEGHLPINVCGRKFCAGFGVASPPEMQVWRRRVIGGIMNKLAALTMVLSAFTFSGANAQEESTMSEIEHLRPQSYAERGWPFSAAVRVGNLLYLSGQIGTLSGLSELAPGGIGPETRQTLENIKMVVEKYGSDMDHVIKCTVFLADIAEWQAMNEVYITFFKPDKLPARSAFGASGLALGARVEIECIALIP